jgi:transcriptional regulator with XRE-family HTH domain
MRGDRFRDLRLRSNLTHEELAEMLGLGVAQIWRYENGKTDPSGTILSRIASAFNVSADYLLGLTDDPDPSLKVDNLTLREKQVLQAMRRGEYMETIKVIVSEAET